VLAKGAQGGTGSYSGAAGGQGGWIQGTLTVTPGDTLYVRVGGKGTDGTTNGSPGGGYNGGGGGDYNCNCVTWYPGGGGGGASDVRVGNNTNSARVVVAGGGGGGGNGNSGGSGDYGGNGGNTTGHSGGGSNPGRGGSQVAGGSASGGGTAGSLAQGGHGGYDVNYGAAGGGGGYYGGGGGGINSGTYEGSGGGGGSNYILPSALNVTYAQGGQMGNGIVTLTYIASPVANISSVPNPSFEGSPVTFTVQVAGLNATGTVYIFDGDTLLGNSTLVNETAFFETFMLSVTLHNITAIYEGDSSNRKATTPILEQDVLLNTTSGTGTTTGGGTGTTGTGTTTGNNSGGNTHSAAGSVEANHWWALFLQLLFP